MGHNGEDDLIQRGRTMVELGLTRAKHALRQWFFFFLGARIHVSMLIALGDALFKVPLDRYGYGPPIFHSEVAVWKDRDEHKSRISSAPVSPHLCPSISLSIKEIRLFLLLMEYDHYSTQGARSEYAREVVATLAGIDILISGFVICENAIGLSFIFHRHSNVGNRMTLTSCSVLTTIAWLRRLLHSFTG